MTNENVAPVQPETDETKIVRYVSSDTGLHNWTFTEWMDTMSGYEDYAWRFSRWLLREGRYDDSDPDPRANAVYLYTRISGTDEFIRQMASWRAAHLDVVEDYDDGAFDPHWSPATAVPPPTDEERHLFAVAMGDVDDSAFPIAFEE